MTFKKFFSSVALTVCLAIGISLYMAPQVYASRMDDRFTYSTLDKMAGDWYNSNGDLVLSISDGYINGCQVLGGYDFAGGTNIARGKFLITEADGNRYLFMIWDLCNTPYHIEFNGEILQRY